MSDVDLILRVCPNAVLVAYDSTQSGEVIAVGCQWPEALKRVNQTVRRVFVRVSHV